MVLTVFQVIIATCLVVTIILQNRGTSAGITFGGSGETFRAKRGLEKMLFYSTIVLSVLFASISIISLILR